jgi:hypothetical protein
MGPGNHQLLLLQPLVCIAHRINADSQLIRQYADGRKLFCPPHLSGKNAPSDIPDQLVRVWDFRVLIDFPHFGVMNHRYSNCPFFLLGNIYNVLLFVSIVTIVSIIVSI